MIASYLPSSYILSKDFSKKVIRFSGSFLERAYVKRFEEISIARIVAPVWAKCSVKSPAPHPISRTLLFSSSAAPEIIKLARR